MSVSLVDSLSIELNSYEGIADTPLAVLALTLAGMIDKGERVPECSRELRQCLLELRITFADTDRKSTLDQLQAKREQRRNA